MSEKNLEKDVGQTGDLFKYLHGSMKSSLPFWDDFLQRGQRFQRSLEQSIVAFTSFLDGFAKLADLATNSKGATHDIGTSLTNMIRWQKALELKIRELNFSLSTKVLTPVNHRLDEWKKQLSNLDKDHDKELNKPLKEAKECLKNTIKSQKTIENKRRKDKQISGLLPQFEQLQMETDQRIADVEQKEKVHMSRIMVEERVWYSTLVNAFMTVLDQLLIVGADFERLPDLMSDLKEHSSSPSILPEAQRDFIEDWQIPSVHSPRLRGSSVHHSTLNLTSSSVPKADSTHSFDSSHSHEVMNISAPIMDPSISPQPPPDAPSLAGYVQNPTVITNPPPPPPPPVQPPPEDHYDVPVPAPYVSVSPSQVSLVSNGSHHSSESTTSSTRSASPQLTRNTCMMPHQHHIGSSYQPSHQFSNPTSAIYQTPTAVHHSDLSFVDRSDMTPSAMKYIPATLPRPRKESNPRPTLPKPNRNNNGQVPRQFSTPQHSYKPNPPRLVKQSSLPQQDNESDDENLSSFALALKQKKLRKTIHVNDRSVPRM